MVDPPRDDPAGAMHGCELPPLREVIRELELSARKSLGQNFILDLNLTRRIARSTGGIAGLDVVEIGPGPGGLTRGLLLEGARRVLVVERDERFLPALQQIAEAWPGRLEIVMGDALDCDWPALVAAHGLVAPRIISNLPYNIATKLLVGWLESEPWPPWFAAMGLMFQREVAERIVAGAASGAYGRLAVIAQWRCRARIDLHLPAAAFTPPPKVASAVVAFEPRAAPQPPCDVKALGRVTAALFGQRRKMLRVSLKRLTAMPELLIEAAGLDPTARAEQLTVTDFARLAALLDQR